MDTTNLNITTEERNAFINFMDYIITTLKSKPALFDCLTIRQKNQDNPLHIMNCYHSVISLLEDLLQMSKQTQTTIKKNGLDIDLIQRLNSVWKNHSDAITYSTDDQKTILKRVSSSNYPHIIIQENEYITCSFYFVENFFLMDRRRSIYFYKNNDMFLTDSISEIIYVIRKNLGFKRIDCDKKIDVV